MNSSRAARAPKPDPCLWTWPIQITDYDCRSRLTTTEQRVLTRELPRAMANRTHGKSDA